MEKIQRNIIIGSIVFNSIILIIFFIFYTFFYNQNEGNINYIKTNSVKIVKNSEIIKNSENPRGIIDDENNINKNILSGFFIDKNTLITASHGVNSNGSDYEIIDINGGKTYSGKLIFKDSENDFAKIKIEEDFKNFEAYKIGNDIKIGDEIGSTGFDKKSNSFVKKHGTILEINGNKIKTNIVFQEGNSGGAIYNKNNEFIGIALEVDIKNNVGYFLKISDFLN